MSRHKIQRGGDQASAGLERGSLSGVAAALSTGTAGRGLGAGHGPTVTRWSCPLRRPPQARLLKPAHFHLLRYLRRSGLLVWGGTAANDASGAELQSSMEHRPRGCC